MPYVIVNDRSDPPVYYCGQGWIRDNDCTVEETAAQHYATLTEATTVMKHRSDLYRLGWRVVPARPR
jgi:hypothetical protein